MKRTGIIVVGAGAVWMWGMVSGMADPAPREVLLVDLEMAQQIALDANPSLQSAAARIRQADARLSQVRATFFPTLGVGGSAYHNQLSPQSVRDIEDALTPLPDDFEQQVQQAVDEQIADIDLASQKALETVRAQQLNQLRRFPALYRAQLDLFAAADRQLQLYSSTFESELSKSDPIGALIESLREETAVDIDDTRTTYQGGAYVSWLLFDGFSRRFSRELARYGLQESEESRRDAQRLLLGAVARAYFQAQLSREEMTISQADLEFNARLLDEAAKRREAGQTSLSTELNFEIRRNVAETSMVNARRRYETSLVALAALVGEPDAAWPAHFELAPLQEELPDQMQAPDPEASIEYALQNRPDVEFARLAAAQGTSGIRLAQSAYSPSLNLTGNYSAFRDDDPGFREDDFGGTVGVILSWNLFEGGSRRARVREAVAVHHETESRFRQAQLTAATEVRTAIVTLRYAGQIVMLQRQNQSIVERTRDLVELEFKAGQASLVRLNEAQRDLVYTRSQYATALASLHVAWQEYQQATARSLEAIE